MSRLGFLLVVAFAAVFVVVEAPPPPSTLPSIFTGLGTSSDFCPTSTTAAIDAANTRAYTFGTSTITILASGCPPTNWTLQKTPNPTRYQCWNVSYPFPPVLQDDANVLYIQQFKDAAKTNANTAFAAAWQWVGFSVKGVPLVPAVDFQGRDAYLYEGSSLDPCGGHSNPYNLYHYHAQTSCAYNSTTGQHDTLYGVMADGVPIYGPLGDGGVPPSNLDICGGHVDTTYPFYHYHVAFNYTYPYLNACLRGCLGSNNILYTQDNAVMSTTCVAATNGTHATTYDYTLFKNAMLASASSTPAAYSCQYNHTSSNSSSSSSSSSSSTGNSAHPGSRSSSSVALFVGVVFVSLFHRLL